MNREILAALHGSGLAAPSFTTLAGRFVIRVAIPNHRSLLEARRYGSDASANDAPCVSPGALEGQIQRPL